MSGSTLTLEQPRKPIEFGIDTPTINYKKLYLYRFFRLLALLIGLGAVLNVSMVVFFFICQTTMTYNFYVTAAAIIFSAIMFVPYWLSWGMGVLGQVKEMFYPTPLTASQQQQSEVDALRKSNETDISSGKKLLSFFLSLLSSIFVIMGGYLGFVTAGEIFVAQVEAFHVLGILTSICAALILTFFMHGLISSNWKEELNKSGKETPSELGERFAFIASISFTVFKLYAVHEFLLYFNNHVFISSHFNQPLFSFMQMAISPASICWALVMLTSAISIFYSTKYTTAYSLRTKFKQWGSIPAEISQQSGKVQYPRINFLFTQAAALLNASGPIGSMLLFIIGSTHDFSRIFTPVGIVLVGVSIVLALARWLDFTFVNGPTVADGFVAMRGGKEKPPLTEISNTSAQAHKIIISNSTIHDDPAAEPLNFEPVLNGLSEVKIHPQYFEPPAKHSHAAPAVASSSPSS